MCICIDSKQYGSQAMTLVLEHSLLYKKQPGNFNLQEFVTSAARKLAVPILSKFQNVVTYASSNCVVH